MQVTKRKVPPPPHGPNNNQLSQHKQEREKIHTTVNLNSKLKQQPQKSQDIQSNNKHIQ
eukprot:m.20635 g.20635  ORF g.20635 m.20635 type:complete len:59 (-) comp5267_c0_seq1:94-270(-)